MNEEREKRCDALVNILLQNELECWQETARSLDAEVKRLREENERLLKEGLHNLQIAETAVTDEQIAERNKWVDKCLKLERMADRIRAKMSAVWAIRDILDEPEEGK